MVGGGSFVIESMTPSENPEKIIQVLEEGLQSSSSCGLSGLDSYGIE